MSVTVKLNCGNGVQLEASGGTIREVFAELADYQSVFGEKTCGQCHEPQVCFEHRTDKENHDYYSLRCRACGAQLSMGQAKTGGKLYPKRKLEDGSWDMENQGWHHWRKKEGDGGNAGDRMYLSPEEEARYLS